MSRIRSCARLGAIAIILLIVITGLDPPWSVLRQAVADPQRTVNSLGADVVVMAVVTAAFQIACSWSLALVALTGAQIVPGSIGKVARLLATRLTPRLLRTVVATAIGMTLLPGAAFATGTSATVSTTAAALPDVDWPQTPASPSSSSSAAPSSTSAAPPSYASAAPPSSTSPTPNQTPAPPSDSASAVVGTGDCLWSIAAAALGAEASTAQISALTDAIYTANSTLIGPNPDLVIAGQILIIPT